MKRTILQITIVIAVLSTFACTNSDYKLRKNALGYIQAMADYDIDAAYPYATEETQFYTLDYFKPMLTILDSNYIASNTPAKITIDSIIHHTDTSATVYFHKETPLQQRADATLDMRLRDGEWLAHQVVERAPFFGRKERATKEENTNNTPSLESATAPVKKGGEAKKQGKTLPKDPQNEA